VVRRYGDLRLLVVKDVAAKRVQSATAACKGRRTECLPSSEAERGATRVQVLPVVVREGHLDDSVLGAIAVESGYISYASRHT
jgi:hypothetical protein